MGELIKFNPPIPNGKRNSGDDYELAHLYVCNCGHQKFLWLADKDTKEPKGNRCANCGEFFEFIHPKDYGKVNDDLDEFDFNIGEEEQ